MIVDAHIHLRQLLEKESSAIEFINRDDYFALCSCHTVEDIQEAFRLAATMNNPEKRLFVSYGIHPFKPEKREILKIEKLAREEKIDAIGEIGLDRFNNQLKRTFDIQTEIFEAQIDIAAKYSLPLVIHIRKAIEELFFFLERLKEVPAVIFHCFSGTSREAEHILRKKVNGFFSFGTPVVNGNKKAVEALKNIPLDRILVETDAPYQPFKDKLFTSAADILKITSSVAEIKRVDSACIRDKVSENFQNILTKRVL